MTDQVSPSANRDEPVAASESDLLQAVIALASHLDLATVLQEFVETGARLTGARYAAIGVLDDRGETSTFVHTGMDEAVVAALGHPPRGHGVLGAIPADAALLLDDLTQHPDFGGFPAAHPPMHTFLGAPVRVQEQVYGRLYLAEKDGGFTKHDAASVRMLATAAAVAIENSQTYETARDRERWLRVEQEITTKLLSGVEEEEALELIAARLRKVSDADTAIIVLPSVGGRWVMEIVDGEDSAELLGTVMPPEGRAMTVLRTGEGVVVDSLARAPVVRIPPLRRFGPALYAPMRARGRGIGVLVLLRREGRQPFDASDLYTAESFAGQAALALVLAEARHAQDVAALLDERARIARDLHDLAIQQLFATGMQLEAARRVTRSDQEDPARLAAIIESALAGVDDTVRQIRQIVRSLRDPDALVPLAERLYREASLARSGLGLAPSLVVEVDGLRWDRSGDAKGPDVAGMLQSSVEDDLADDVVAVVREGFANAARHAGASAVEVRVTVTRSERGGRLEVVVEDDGVGPDPASTRRSGLENLAARARKHGGSSELRPGRSSGSGDRSGEGSGEGSGSGRMTRKGSMLVWRVPLG